MRRGINFYFLVDQSPLSSSVEVTPKSRTLRRNERGETQLHIVCIKGDLKTATSLVEQGAEVDSVDNAGKMETSAKMIGIACSRFCLIFSRYFVR